MFSVSLPGCLKQSILLNSFIKSQTNLSLTGKHQGFNNCISLAKMPTIAYSTLKIVYNSWFIQRGFGVVAYTVYYFLQLRIRFDVGYYVLGCVTQQLASQNCQTITPNFWNCCPAVWYDTCDSMTVFIACVIVLTVSTIWCYSVTDIQLVQQCNSFLNRSYPHHSVFHAFWPIR